MYDRFSGVRGRSAGCCGCGGKHIYPIFPRYPLWRKPDKEPREIKDMLLTEKYRRRSGVPHGADNRWVLCVFDAWPTPEDCVCGEEENRGTLTDDES